MLKRILYVILTGISIVILPYLLLLVISKLTSNALGLTDMPIVIGWLLCVTFILAAIGLGILLKLLYSYIRYGKINLVV
jgi:hypothetical protein